MVRIEEARQSAALIGEAARRAAPGAVFAAPGPLRAGAHATGLVEGWRGPIWHWVLAAGAGTLPRVKVVDPPFRNWPALEYALLNKIVPGFPPCKKAFNPSYPGKDPLRKPGWPVFEPVFEMTGRRP